MKEPFGILKKWTKMPYAWVFGYEATAEPEERWRCTIMRLRPHATCPHSRFLRVEVWSVMGLGTTAEKAVRNAEDKARKAERELVEAK